MRRLSYYDRMCARCRCNLYETDCTGESGLYSPNRSFTLCEPCFFDEEAETDREGTNDIPLRVEEYRQHMRLGPVPGLRPRPFTPPLVGERQ